MIPHGDVRGKVPEASLTRAGELGVEIVDEASFLKMLGGGQAE